MVKLLLKDGNPPFPPKISQDFTIEFSLLIYERLPRMGNAVLGII